ncbi:MAG TPA: amidohydrolase, partial [Flavobacteriales bacterium]|nr:amidohydrolase [Flavobacteriales bacterium]
MTSVKMNKAMRIDRCIAVLIGLVAAGSLFAQRPTPAPTQTKSVLVTGGTVHTGDGTTIDDGAVGFRNGIIDFVGHTYGATAKYDTVIDVKGQHVYPGFIAPDVPLGLVEVEQARATVDQDDVGTFEPELRTISAYKADSRVIPTVRANGVLLAQIAPRGLVIGGTSSVVQLDAWDNDGAIVREDDAVFMNWPVAYQRSGWWAEPGETDAEKKDERAKRIEEIRSFVRKAKAYAQNEQPTEVDVRMEGMRGLFDGSRSLFVRANAVREIIEAVQFAKAEGVKRTVIVGGYDAWRVADLLRENHVDVVLRRTHSLPMRVDDDIDMPYRLPVLLKERGVRFCLGYAEGSREVSGIRSLGFVAGTARAYGLSNDEALRAI